MLARDLPEYVILDRLAQGGNGTVYLARRAGRGDRVALMVLHPEIASQPDRTAMFLRRARALSRLEHPGLVKILDVIEAPRVVAVSMELLEGESVAERRLRGGLSDDETAAIGSALREALAAVRAAGIDLPGLSPSDVFLTTGGKAKILSIGPLLEGAALAGPDDRGLRAEPPGDAPRAGDVQPAPGKRGRMAAMGAALAGAAVLLAVARGLPASTDRASIEDVDQAARIPSLAVLPLAMPPSGDLDLRSDSGLDLADSIITAVSALGRMRVRPTFSVERFAGAVVDPLAAGRELHVRHVLSGEILRQGGSLSARLRLHDVLTGEAEWFETIGLGSADLRDLRDQIVAVVVQRLRAGPAAGRPKRSA